MEPVHADPLAGTTAIVQPRLRPPKVVPDLSLEPEVHALITMKVWHLAIVSAIFVLVFWHFVLGLY
jgi:hypothetical protein